MLRHLRRCEAVRTEQPAIERLSAVTLLTSDMAEAVSFYRVMGFELLFGGPDASFTSYQVGGSYLNLQAHAPRPVGSPPWGRVVFWVHDVDAMHRRALEAGFAPQTEPADGPWGERYFHIRDPDGHELSLARPLSRPV